MSWEYVPAPPHDCALPGGTLPDGPINAVWRCDDCGLRWVIRPTDLWRVWVVLSWWHRAARRGLKKARA